MSKVLVVFGSTSDEHVYNEIVNVLKENEITYELRALSAHRTPDELEDILPGDYNVVIAGAGLAAHLPGVVASKCIHPIIGVPVSGNYEGMDALLSIMQMPPGIPVMSVGVEKSKVAGKMASAMFKEYKDVNLFYEGENKPVKKCKDILDEFEITYNENPEFKSGCLNIKFITLDEMAEERDDLVIYVPLLDKGDDKAEAALNVLKNSTNGLWVGLNRGENAALAAIEIMNIQGHLSEKLNAYRQKSKEKVKKADEKIRNG